MRSPDELLRVHDLIVGLLRNDSFQKSADRVHLADMKACADVLCWVLRHDENTAFADLIADLREIVAIAKGLKTPPEEVIQ